jgi:AraC family transcriptional regulator
MSKVFPIHIKHMVCPRCISAVQLEIEKLELEVDSIKLGEVVLKTKPDDAKLQVLQVNLQAQGFEIISDHKSSIINQIKTEIIKVIHHDEEMPAEINFSSYLASKIGSEYSSLSNLFSSIEGMTIEKYIIFQKVEKVKEFIVYNELTFSEIAFKLGYSSSQHLSSQFKKITGLSPSHFKKIQGEKRKPIDQISETNS